VPASQNINLFGRSNPLDIQGEARPLIGADGVAAAPFAARRRDRGARKIDRSGAVRGVNRGRADPLCALVAALRNPKMRREFANRVAPIRARASANALIGRDVRRFFFTAQIGIGSGDSTPRRRSRQRCQGLADAAAHKLSCMHEMPISRGFLQLCDDPARGSGAACGAKPAR
jgi:hypothetical protein